MEIPTQIVSKVMPSPTPDKRLPKKPYAMTYYVAKVLRDNFKVGTTFFNSDLIDYMPREAEPITNSGIAAAVSEMANNGFVRGEYVPGKGGAKKFTILKMPAEPVPRARPKHKQHKPVEPAKIETPQALGEALEMRSVKVGEISGSLADRLMAFALELERNEMKPDLSKVPTADLFAELQKRSK